MPEQTVTRTPTAANLDRLIHSARQACAVVEWNTAHGFDGTDVGATAVHYRRQALDAVRDVDRELGRAIRVEDDARRQMRHALDQPGASATDDDGMTEAVSLWHSAQERIAKARARVLRR